MAHKRKSRLMGFEEFMQLSEKGDRKRSMGDGKAELGRFLEIHNGIHEKLREETLNMAINEQLLKTEKENAEKDMYIEQ